MAFFLFLLHYLYIVYCIELCMYCSITATLSFCYTQTDFVGLAVGLGVSNDKCGSAR